MANDYLDELIGAVKQGAKETAQKDGQAIQTNQNQQNQATQNQTNNSQNQLTQNPATQNQTTPFQTAPAQNQQIPLAQKQMFVGQKTQSTETRTAPQKIVLDGKKPEDLEEQIAQEIIKKDLKSVTQEAEPEQDMFDKTTIEKELEINQKIEIKSYGKVKIYKIPGKPLAYYFTPTTRPTASERKMINTLKEATTRLVSIAPYKIRNPEERRIIYKQKIIEIIKSNPTLRIPETRLGYYADAVVREMIGYGLIDDLIKDDNLEEIMIVGPKKPVYVFHREYEMMLTNIEFYSEQEIEDVINKIARDVGRRVDVSAPLLDARLTDGSRVNATIPPASISGGTITIRKFRQDPYSIIDLVRMGTLNSEAAAFLWLAVEGLSTKPANILISGGTGSGKTTLLNVLAAFIPDRERIITIEDTAELNLPIKHWIRLEARPPGLEGTGELKMDILTKNSLRMRPDRIIVGEIRHEEAFTLFTALNTGHDGALAKNTLIQLSNGNITEIETLADKYFKKNTPIKESDYEFVEINDELFVPSMNKTTLKMENRKVTRIWRKKAETKLIKIKLKSGKEIMLTKDHPIYKIQNGIQEINSCDAKENEWIAIPRKISVGSEERIMEPHLLGLIYGDGHVGQEGVEFVNKEKSVINFFNEASRRITQNKITEKDYGTYYRTKFFDKKIVKKLNDEYNIPIGNKTKTFKIQEKILATNPLELSKLIQGLYDCEAHVNNKANCIQFSTSNPDLAKKLPLILQRYGIMTSTYAQAMDGKGNYGPYYRISLYGKENILLFSEKIGFGHDRKKEKLLQLISRAKQSIDVFPNIERIMRDARSENKMTRKELSALLGTNTTSTINAYETKARNPTREQLHKISEIIKTPLGGQLKILAESELKFERIILVSEENYTGYVYDLTVEGNHNYIANGLVVSNCLGTVHANSPEETIVRLTSPPMNVPSIMLSGLDLIVVEHRYYDRKKGTLRRISEIAEVYGSIEGKPKTQTLYQRDPIKDTLERTLVESKYLKILQKFTGISRERLDAELLSRKLFIESMVQKNIRGLGEVSEKAKNYIIEREMGD